MYLLPHTYIASPIINIPHDRQTFVTTDEPMLAHLHHLNPMVYIRVHPWCYILYGFGSIYSNLAATVVIQSGFIALKIFCVPPIHPSFPSKDWQLRIFLWSPWVCLFQDVMKLESYSSLF